MNFPHTYQSCPVRPDFIQEVTSWMVVETLKRSNSMDFKKKLLSLDLKNAQNFFGWPNSSYSKNSKVAAIL